MRSVGIECVDEVVHRGDVDRIALAHLRKRHGRKVERLSVDVALHLELEQLAETSRSGDRSRRQGSLCEIRSSPSVVVVLGKHLHGCHGIPPNVKADCGSRSGQQPVVCLHADRGR